MPFPAFIKFHLNGTVLSGRTMKAWGLDDVREVWEFDHEVGNGHYEDYGYRKEWAYSHCPLTVITEIGNHVPPLYNSICTDENLEKVEIFWPQYKSKEHKEDIYFTHKLWPVKIRSVELFFPNVKDRQFEKYGHLAKIVFRYHWIEWKYVQGNRIFKGEWPSFSTEGMQDDKNRKELEEVENAPMSAQESAFLDYWENKDKKKNQPDEADKIDFITVEDGQKIVKVARKWIGTPYLSKGITKKGADCSGAVNGIYTEAGFPFDHCSSFDFVNDNHFKPSPGNSPQVGDVGYWPGHLMIYEENSGTTHKKEIANGWSASHPGGDAFDVARYQWFDTHYKASVRWYRYLKSNNSKR